MKTIIEIHHSNDYSSEEIKQLVEIRLGFAAKILEPIKAKALRKMGTDEWYYWYSRMWLTATKPIPIKGTENYPLFSELLNILYISFGHETRRRNND